MNKIASSFANLILSKAVEMANYATSLQDFVSIPEVSAGFHDEYRTFDVEEQKRFVVRLAIAMARETLPVWIEAYPDRTGPVDAVIQAEKWVDSPSDDFAELASATQPAAVHESLCVWRQEPKSAAWAARTAAWVADAPKYGWQALCAIMGAQQALGVDNALSSAIRFHEMEKRRVKKVKDDQVLGIEVITFAGSSSPSKDSIGWHTISFRVWELLCDVVHTKPDEFPILGRVQYEGTFEVRDPSELVALIEETERIPGDDDEFRRSMGRIHGAAAHSLSTGGTVSFLGEPRMANMVSPRR